ncbi:MULTISPECIES: Slam-dependent surface lipoprotein [Glaesserella]|uniref:Transferrin-binding protein B C-lobe/N-lobe beta-barrel domain-containing protein n=1 Tax=Glaesserella australis TaxID=2094024 RepID=A0A328BVC3_9PAST|nr:MULTISPECIES: Slam-dependent surface lipoprotein [Glaesserella]AUI65139.1 hypothetical protein CJD39_00470 [Glaesserella sp. 15-184]RAL18039.1 hypothetical protein C5N92_09135 [Glaesserella australis]
MKGITKLSLTLLAGIVLTACGGSGGGSSSNSASSVQPIDTSSSTATSNNSTSSPSNTTSSNSTNSATTVSNSTGGTYVFSGIDDNVTTTYKVLNDASDLNFIVVDGQKIRVAYSNITSGSWTTINNTSVCCGKFTDVRFGAIGSTGPNEKDYIFYNGNPTQSVPTSGSATYTGHFIITGNHPVAFEDEDYLKGNVNFTANFSAKTLAGNLTDVAGLNPISVNTQISGNSFTGEANSSDFATKAVVEGKFFGENAKELGGIFKDNGSTWGGAFGASKQ